jgi:hypothetical protein
MMGIVLGIYTQHNMVSFWVSFLIRVIEGKEDTP